MTVTRIPTTEIFDGDGESVRTIYIAGSSRLQMALLTDGWISSLSRP